MPDWFWEAASDWSAIVQAVSAIAIGVLTFFLIRTTGRSAQDTNRLAAAADAQLRESIQHRNLVERQLHAVAVEEIRRASIQLLDASTGQPKGRHPMTLAIQAWSSVMANRALSLPPAVFGVVREPWRLADDVVKRAFEFTPLELQALSGKIALAVQDGLDRYMRAPGEALAPNYPLPEVGSNYSEWIRDNVEEKEA